MFRRILRRTRNRIDTINDCSKPLFPCYKLPLDIQEHIVGFMDEYEIIQGSLISANFRLAVRQAKIKLAHFSIVQKQKFDEFDARDEFRRLLRKPAPAIMFSDYCIKFFWTKQEREVDRLLDKKLRVPIDEDVRMAVLGRNIIIYNSHSRCSKLEAYQFILDVIFGTFLVDTFCIGDNWEHYGMPKDTMIHLALRYQNSVRLIELMQGTGVDACTNLTSEDLSAILGNLEDPEIRLVWKTKRGVKYTGILKTKKMAVYEASWLTIDNLLTMECEELVAHRTNFTALEVVSFIRKWLEGGLEQLKSLTLYHEESEINWITLLDEFEVEWSEGRRLLRRADGKVARIVIVRNFMWITID